MLTRSIEIPKLLKDKLAEDLGLAGYVETQLRSFSTWIKDSGMPFFPEYTDHGLDHIERILRTSEWLIHDDVWEKKLFTAVDSACLILAVLLHDIAMHITTDIAEQLLTDETPSLFTIDTNSWASLWNSYQLETKHWDEQKWMQIAGTDFKQRIPVIIGEPYYIELTRLLDGDKLILGEFFRRHHGRLAHEFAVRGVPISFRHQNYLKLDDNLDYPRLADMVGFIARSHTLSLRDTLSYLEHKFHNKREVFNQTTHPVFIMSLLRIADYLDLYTERAPKTLQKVKRIRSEFSSAEWEAHHAIQDIQYDANEDPELVQVIAMPESANTFQKVLGWVTGIQAELDASWGVLGEVFGRHKRLSELKLRLRRITTPLSDPDFASKHNLSYSPIPGYFALDGQKIIQLLIKPLYGDKPEIAVRELLQNAVDAVNAAHIKYPNEQTQDTYPVLKEMSAEIVIRLCERDASNSNKYPNLLEDWEYWLEIVDCGLGMSEEIVRNYFLTIGASFRYSASFNELFNKSQQNQIFRTGRFGIGVLAAFLSGELMQVVTRTREAQKALLFECGIHSNDIEFRYINAPVGTQIRIKLNSDAYNHLYPISLNNTNSHYVSPYKLDWYIFSSPNIVIGFHNDSSFYKIERMLQLPAPDIMSVWRSIYPITSEPYIIQWKPANSLPFILGELGGNVVLFINGFYIQAFPSHEFKEFLSQELHCGAISIKDATERVPLNITRDTIDDLPYKEEIVQDIVFDHLAWLFLQADLKNFLLTPFDAPCWKVPSLTTDTLSVTSDLGSYGISNKGILPLTQWHLNNAGLNQVFFLASNVDNVEFYQRFFSSWQDDRIIFFAKYNIGGYRFGNETEVDLLSQGLLSPHKCSFFKTLNSSLLLPNDIYKRLITSLRKELPMEQLINLGTLHSGNPVRTDNNIKAPFLEIVSAFKKDFRNVRNVVGLMSLEIEPNSSELTRAENAFSALWKELNLPTVIPWEREKRKALLSHELRTRISQIYEFSYDMKYHIIEKWW